MFFTAIGLGVHMDSNDIFMDSERLTKKLWTHKKIYGLTKNVMDSQKILWTHKKIWEIGLWRKNLINQIPRLI